jgi:hypothetical protein
MRRIYIILLLLITGIAGSSAQMSPSVNMDDETGIKIKHNLETNILRVSYSSSLRSNLCIKIKDYKGVVLYTENIPEEKTQHNSLIYMGKYAKGVYFVEVDTERAQDVERMELN